MSLFGELRRRNVFKVGAAYAIVAWLLIQIADVLLPAFGAPEWVLPVFSVMIVLGFPVAVLLAWAYEVTPDGVRAESGALSPPAVTQVTDRKLIYVILALVVVVAGFQITDRMGFERQTSSEINPAIRVTMGSDSTSYPTDVSADGKTLFYRNSSLPEDVWQVPIGEGVQRGERIIAGPDRQMNATLAPNGRWLAYQSNESGQAEIYVRPYPDIDSARIMISRDGGSHPLWSKDGSELFYLTASVSTDGALVTVTVDTESSFSAGLPEQLFEDVFVLPIQGRQVYDVSEDGQRFLMFQAPGQSDYQNVIGDIIFVQNWFEELNRLVPTE